MLPRLALIFLGVLVTAIVSLAIWFYTGGPFGAWRRQMAAGGTYMRSLNDSDMAAWIERSKRFLGEFRPDMHPIGVYSRGDKPVPPDLARLRIVRVDIFEDKVCYVWMGGMDHTYLEARRLPDGSFTLVAHYNDYKSEVIWPKRPNQAMQRTARRAAADLLRVCPPRSRYVSCCIGLAVADLVLVRPHILRRTYV